MRRKVAPGRVLCGPDHGHGNRQHRGPDVQQAVQDYIEQATQKELKQIMGQNGQEILKKVS
jgi:hypothetical protein